MKRRAVLAAALGAVTLGAVSVAVATSAPPAPPFPPGPAVRINESPANGVTPFAAVNLTVAQLGDSATYPQTTDTVTINGQSTTETGPSLFTILADAGAWSSAGDTPLSSATQPCKNDILRYAVSVTGRGGATVVLTGGEIDPGFGNDGAILSVSENGQALSSPRLIVPSDGTPAPAGNTTDSPDIQGVANITVSRATPQLYGNASEYGETAAGNSEASCTTFTPIPTPAEGTVVVNGEVAHPLTLTAAQLGALPQLTQYDTYVAGGGTKYKEEQGPTLFDVISAAEPQFNFYNPNDDLRFYVEVTSYDDGYAANVSYAEISPFYNGKPMLLSLAAASCTSSSPSSCGTLTPLNPAAPVGSWPTLTVPGDLAGGRYVSGVAVITVFAAANAGPVPPSPPWLVWPPTPEP